MEDQSKWFYHRWLHRKCTASAMELPNGPRVILVEEKHRGQEPSLHDSSLVIDEQKEQGLVPTSEMGSLYHAEEDPAKPPLQVPVYLFANTSIEDVGTRVTNGCSNTSLGPEHDDDIVLSSDNMKVDIDSISSHIESCRVPTADGQMLGDEGTGMPEFLRSITPVQNKNEENIQQHIITIIQDSEEAGSDDDEEGMQDTVSDEQAMMLRRFVVDVSGLHPTESGAIGQAAATSSIVGAVGSNRSLTTAGHQVIIFSNDDPVDCEKGNFTRNGDMSDEVTVTLMKDDDQADQPTSMLTSYRNYDNSNMATGHRTISWIPSDDAVPLDMAFEVVSEIATQDGEICMREITTQTKPKKKMKIQRKRKIRVGEEEEGTTTSTTSGQHTQTDLPPEGDEDSDTYQAKRLQRGGGKKFKCTKCNLKFQTPELRALHVNCHQDSSKSYCCIYCQHTEPQWVKMYNHLFQHGVEKPHKCPDCTFTCVNKSDITAHMTVHSKTKDWHCPKCGRAFKHRRNMVAHQRTCPGLDETGKPQKAEGEEKFICYICSKQLSSKKNLEKHMEIHLNVKPFVCDQCGHSTRLKESLIMHKRLHTGEKPYKCDICHYATPDKSSLRRHKRIHSNEKPYKCQFCNYTCIQKHCLDTHLRRKHTGEQFVCGLCHYATHDRYGLNQHFKRHQNINEVTLSEEGMVSGATLAQVKELVPSSSESNLITLQSGAIIKKTVIGKNTLLEEVPKTSAPLQDIGQVLLRIDVPISTVSHAKGEPSTSSSNLATTAESNSTTKNSTTTEWQQLSSMESEILQQIQQPGDEVFLQPTGEIVIRRQDGHLLVIQQQEADDDTAQYPTEVVDGEEYLTALTAINVAEEREPDAEPSAVENDDVTTLSCDDDPTTRQVVTTSAARVIPISKKT